MLLYNENKEKVFSTLSYINLINKESSHYPKGFEGLYELESRNKELFSYEYAQLSTFVYYKENMYKIIVVSRNSMKEDNEEGSFTPSLRSCLIHVNIKDCFSDKTISSSALVVNYYDVESMLEGDVLPDYYDCVKTIVNANLSPFDFYY